MRISDWSSDVCSSDLIGKGIAGARIVVERDRPLLGHIVIGTREVLAKNNRVGGTGADILDKTRQMPGNLRIGRAIVGEIGRASGRERVCQNVCISVVAV